MSRARTRARTNLKGLKNNTPRETPEQEEKEKSSFTERAKQLRDKLKLGPHHRMERFIIVVSTTMAFLLLFIGLSFTAYRSDVANLASSQAVYTEDFTFSLSGQRGSVVGVYGNKERTDVMVLLKMQNPAEMSTNAENYELFITTRGKKMSYEPNVSFSIFGSTGYGIIRFQHTEPLKKEVLNVTIRANASISLGEGRGATEDQDASFDNFDQARIFVNVGAENVEELEGLRPFETDPRKLYIALVAEKQDKEIHKKIDEKIELLDQYLKRADEYTNRLVSAGYIPPEEPWFVKGDYVDEDGRFHSATDVARAHKFDYWSKTIHDGYINQVMDDFSKYDEYMQAHAPQTSGIERKEEERREQVERVEELHHTDGSVLQLNMVTTGQSSSAQVSAKDSVEALTKTWLSYLKEKQRLQRDLMTQLLVLDADVQSQPLGYTIHEGDTVVTFY